MMKRATAEAPRSLNGRSWRPAFWRSRTLWLSLFFCGFAVWQATRAESVSQFFVSLLLWGVGFALAYWVVVIWDVLFSTELR